MEHDCVPSCSFTTEGSRLYLCAIRDVAAGDRISIDYTGPDGFYKPHDFRAEELRCNDVDIILLRSPRPRPPTSANPDTLVPPRECVDPTTTMFRVDWSASGGGVSKLGLQVLVRVRMQLHRVPTRRPGQGQGLHLRL